jgi:SRSO17 transposase
VAVSLPVAYQLYLPEIWAGDRRRRPAAGVPDEIPFQPKWQIALAQIQTGQAEGPPRAPVVADAGDTTAFQEALTTMGLYAVGVTKETTAWPPGQALRPPKRWTGRCRPSTRVRRAATQTPQSLKQLAGALPTTAWRAVTWRKRTRVRRRPAYFS